MAQTVDWAIQKAFLLAQRKAIPPIIGTTKYQVLLDLADTLQKMWAAEPGIEWDSLYTLESIGTTSSTDSYSLPDELDYISKNEADPVRLVSPDGTVTKEYRLIRPNQLYRHRNECVCAQIDTTLKFAKPFSATDVDYGYTINVPGILYVNDITKGSDEIQVYDPMWLAYMMAAEFCRNDVVKVGQYGNLINYAAQAMERMKNANSGQLDEVELGSNWTAGVNWT
jgi:hypothetical protein